MKVIIFVPRLSFIHGLFKKNNLKLKKLRNKLTYKKPLGIRIHQPHYSGFATESNYFFVQEKMFRCCKNVRLVL